MVQIVVRGGRDPARPRIVHPPCRKQLAPRVGHHVADHLVPDEEQDCIARIGDPQLAGDQQEHRHESDLDHRLGHGEAVGRPRRGRARLVVMEVRRAEQLLGVHRPVRPVEPRVVRDHDQRELPDDRPQRGVLDRQQDHPGLAPDEDRQRDEGIDNNRPHRGEDFAHVIGARCPAALLDAAPSRKAVKHQQQRCQHPRRDQVAAEIEIDAEHEVVRHAGHGVF